MLVTFAAAVPVRGVASKCPFHLQKQERMDDAPAVTTYHVLGSYNWIVLLYCVMPA